MSKSDGLISRQAAIDALGERPMVWIDDDQYALGERNQYDLDKLAIETVPSEQPDLSEHSTWFRIGETLVDESKMHITAEQAINKIRGYMIRMQKPEQRWIPCSERLPERVGSYLVTHTTVSGGYSVDYDYWTVCDEFKYHPENVVAWMPFPEPYKEKEK